MAEGRPNHVLRAARPAFVKAWVFDQDGQVVTAPIVPGVRAGWTARDIVAPDPSDFLHMVQNAEFRPTVSVVSTH